MRVKVSIQALTQVFRGGLNSCIMYFIHFLKAILTAEITARNLPYIKRGVSHPLGFAYVYFAQQIALTGNSLVYESTFPLIVFVRVQKSLNFKIYSLNCAVELFCNNEKFQHMSFMRIVTLKAFREANCIGGNHFP